MLVVKCEAKESYRRVVVATDFSVHARRAMRVALRLAPGAELHLVHAFLVPFQGLMYGASAQREVEAEHERGMSAMVDEEMRIFLASFEGAPPRVHQVCREGMAQEVILRDVVSKRADLLVLGTHGRTGVAHASSAAWPKSCWQRRPATFWSPGVVTKATRGTARALLPRDDDRGGGHDAPRFHAAAALPQDQLDRDAHDPRRHGKVGQNSSEEHRMTRSRNGSWRAALVALCLGLAFAAAPSGETGAQLRDPPLGWDMWDPGWTQRDTWHPERMDQGLRWRTTRHQAFLRDGVPAAYRGVRNPLQRTPETIRQGGALYLERCAGCHDPSGTGHGDAGLALYPSPALLADLIRMPQAVDEYLLWAISEGGAPFGTQMPAFKDALSEEQMWQIIAYMRAGFPAPGAGGQQSPAQ